MLNDNQTGKHADTRLQTEHVQCFEVTIQGLGAPEYPNSRKKIDEWDGKRNAKVKLSSPTSGSPSFFIRKVLFFS